MRWDVVLRLTSSLWDWVNRIYRFELFLGCHDRLSRKDQTHAEGFVFVLRTQRPTGPQPITNADRPPIWRSVSDKRSHAFWATEKPVGRMSVPNTFKCYMVRVGEEGDEPAIRIK